MHTGLDFDEARFSPPGCADDASIFGVTLEEGKIVVDGQLEITFRRTIRVPDNDQISQLPPDLGAMDLVNVNRFAKKLPLHMAAKGGLLLAMRGMYIICNPLSF